MKSIPLDDGELTWVFPGLVETDAVLDALHDSQLAVDDLAKQVGAKAGSTGCGVEFHRYPSGQEELTSVVYGPEWDDSEFLAELRPAGFYGDDDPNTGWFVEASISIRCDAEVDCGMHTVERLPEHHASAPTEAAVLFAHAANWLHERGTTEPRTYWREHDRESGHPPSRT